MRNEYLGDALELPKEQPKHERVLQELSKLIESQRAQLTVLELRLKPFSFPQKELAETPEAKPLPVGSPFFEGILQLQLSIERNNKYLQRISDSLDI